MQKFTTSSVPENGATANEAVEDRDRRRFLKSAAVIGASTLASRVFAGSAASPGKHVLIGGHA